MASQSLNLRRGALALAATLIALSTLLQIPGPRVAAQGNPIAAENALTGNPSSEWDVSGAGDSSIQGFAANMSVTPGQTVQFKISTSASNYTINIYRMGDSPTPDASWTAFAPVGTGGVVSGSSRYIQYMVTMTSTAGTKAPIVQDVTITYKRQ